MSGRQSYPGSVEANTAEFLRWADSIIQRGNAMRLTLGHRYEVGSQPCQNLVRSEGPVQGISNVHQCPKCWGNRTFCTNCNTDHHDNGWETCKPNAYECAEEEQPLRGELL